ncbi:hypothetical protein BD408DRAFT_433895 [Parasitella parasitica]|nr:hypothetical protein BD408DRAFT_433895 [Parasitella parasitica]
MAVVKPFMKGVEQGSVFVDLTTVKDRSLLDKALVKFIEAAIQNDLYEDFLDHRKQTRSYLGHAFLETMWLPTGSGRKTIIETGLTLEDGTSLKDFLISS